MWKNTWRLFPLLVLTAVTPACDDFGTGTDATGPVPSAIELVTPVDSADAVVGTSHTVTLRVLDADDQPVEGVTAELSVSGDGSIDPTTVTTDGAGEVTATWTLGTTAGAQTLTASVEGLSALDVTVPVAPGAVATLTVSPDSVVFQALTAEAALAADGADEHGNAVTAAVAWTSRDPAVATVDTGVVTAAANGRTWVVGTADGASDSLEVIVAQAPESVALSVSNDTLPFAMGGGVSLEASAVDAEGVAIDDAEITWSSSDPGVIEYTAAAGLHVDGGGGFHITGLGVTQLTASIGGASATATLRVAPDTRLSLAPGANHVCFLDLDGTAYCSGFAGVGQLGTGAVSSDENLGADTPTPVDGGHTFVQLASGGHHTCGLTPDGAVYCWGYNVNGELGAASGDEYSAVPVAVSTSHVFQRLTAVWNGMCGLTVGGDVYCWGSNNGYFGESDGMAGADAPVPVQTGYGFQDLAVGLTWAHVCALGGDGVFCWGENYGGQLGNGTTTPSSTPVQVTGGTEFTALSVGLDQACGLDPAGTAWCWGANFGSIGILGNGSTEDSPVPVQVSSNASYATIASGNGTNCATTHDGAVDCWGWGIYGQVGDGSGLSSSVPTTVSSAGTFVAAVAGAYSACGITDSHEAECWGFNYDGQLGLGPTAYYRAAPGPVVGAYVDVDASSSHACGITTSGAAECWGENGYGELGNGSTAIEARTPVAVSGGHMFVDIDVGENFSCAIDDAGAVWCWGTNHAGRLGDGTTNASSPVPVAVDGPAGTVFEQVSATYWTACARAASGAVWCWGANAYGQHGDGTVDVIRTTPVQVDGGIDFSQIAVGRWHTCGIDPSGNAWCWGLNAFGQLGDGTFNNATTPVAVSTSLTFSHLTGGFNTTCGVATDDTGYCWGADFVGVRGDGGGDGEPAATPVAVAGGLSFQAIELANWSSACGLTTAGTGYCWGLNYYGEAGVGTLGILQQPTQVAGGGSYTQIDIGQYSACAIATSGDTQCWGHYGYGELGDGTSIRRLAPGVVLGGLTFPVGTPQVTTASSAGSITTFDRIFRTPTRSTEMRLDRPEGAPGVIPEPPTPGGARPGQPPQR